MRNQKKAIMKMTGDLIIISDVRMCESSFFSEDRRFQKNELNLSCES